MGFDSFWPSFHGFLAVLTYVFFFLLPLVYLWLFDDGHCLKDVGELKLIANGLVAFLLNIAIFLAISVCSGLLLVVFCFDF